MMKPPPPNAYGMQPAAPMPPQHRPPGPYPSIASKPQQQQQQQQQMVPSAQPDYNAQQTSNLIGAPPNQQTPVPPPTGPQQTYHYQPQQPMPRY